MPLRSPAIASLLLLVASVSRAEVRTVWDRNQGPAAIAGFKFKDVPSPSRTDAAAPARIAIAAGEVDPNGAGLEALNDGRLPANEDQPEANFFFDVRSGGGRLMVDLGVPAEVRRVNSYSWHPGARGPQVYRLYGDDGSARDLPALRDRTMEIEKAGWRLIASVDTRPKEGPPGGQYGVSTFDAGGAPLGKYRYLLFDISRTTEAERFASTFFSEIDVDDGKEHAPLPPPASSGECEIVIDSSEVPELKEWIEARLRPTLEKWYPIIVESLPSEGFTAPRRFTVTFRKDMRGVAATGGTRVSCAGNWFLRNRDGEAVGAVVHELVHVAQQYRSRTNPGWLVEGVADYIRWFRYEPESLRPRPDPARARYTDSYRTTAAFLNFLTETRDREIVKKLNAAMRRGEYAPSLWKEYAGKDVDDLWADFVQTLPARERPRQRSF